MKIYLDLLFIQNFVITSLIIFLTSKLLDLRASFTRVLITSFVDSCATVMLLIFFPTLVDSMLLKFLNAFFIIRFGLNVKSREKTFFEMVILWLVTIFFGGLAFSSGGSFFKLLIFLCVAIIYILKFLKNKNKKLLLEATTCFIEFELFNEKCFLKCLVDTGHDVRTIFDEDVIFIKDDLLKWQGGDGISKRKVKYHTVSGMEEKTGIKIYNIKINYNGRSTYNNAVIVSTPNILNDFDAIVSLNFIEGGKKNGNYNVYEGEGKKTVS